MRARKLIDGASFGPGAVKAIGEAFDAAWAEIDRNFGNDPTEIECARLRLANAVLSIASEESRGCGRPEEDGVAEGWHSTIERECRLTISNSATSRANR
jgi:hypothetical protein